VGVQFPKETSPSAKRVGLLYRKGADSQIETAEVWNYRMFEQMAYARRMLQAFSKFPWEWQVHCEVPDGYVRKTYFALLSTTHHHPVTYFPEGQLTEQTFTEVPTQSFVTISYPILIFPPPMSSLSEGFAVPMPTFPSSIIFNHHLFDHPEITSPFVYVVEEAS
jgi:YD repeat-containing protein